MKSLSLALGVMLAIVVCANGFADSGDRGKTLDKDVERVEILRMWRMMETLDLDKQTADKIFEIRSRFLEERQDLRRQIRDDFQRLRQLVAQPSGQPDEKELAKALSDIRDTRAKLKSLWDRQYDEVSKLLTIPQQAKLLIFLKDFSRSIRALRRPHPRPGGPPHDRGPDFGPGRFHGPGPDGRESPE